MAETDDEDEAARKLKREKAHGTQVCCPNCEEGSGISVVDFHRPVVFSCAHCNTQFTTGTDGVIGPFATCCYSNQPIAQGKCRHCQKDLSQATLLGQSKPAEPARTEEIFCSNCHEPVTTSSAQCLRCGALLGSSGEEIRLA